MALLLQHLPELLKGTAYTLVSAAFGVALSLILGSLLGVIQSFRLPGIRSAITAYVEAVRNTPELVQLYWIYLVLPSLGLNLTIDQAVLLYLAFNGTAYTGEIVKGAVLSIPRGQFEAARALGLWGFRLYARIILPQAVRKVIPALTNQMTMILKNTTLVSFIAAQDVVYFANQLSSQTLQPIPFQLYTGAVFFVIITLLGLATKRFEARGLAS